MNNNLPLNPLACKAAVLFLTCLLLVLHVLS